jgi:hypothetical protein
MVWWINKCKHIELENLTIMKNKVFWIVTWCGSGAVQGFRGMNPHSHV